MVYAPPELNKDKFNCPHCNAFSQQLWYNGEKEKNNYRYEVGGLRIAFCTCCEKHSFWYRSSMVYPSVVSVPPPNEDLGEELKDDYLEAATILDKSPRGAAALLRLVIQKLCIELGEKGEDLNTDIANLVKKGLPAQIQKALDTVRVVGNEAVHPGKIDLDDNKHIAIKLFDLVNLIAQIMITQPKEIEVIYNSLPEEKLEAIKQRDKPKI